MDTLVTFNDKHGRKIVISCDYPDIVAKCGTNEIARWTFAELENGEPLLGLAEMNKDFEQAGIGEQMLLASEEIHDDFYIADHFSIEGAAFFNRCFEKGTNTKKHKAVRDDRF